MWETRRRARGTARGRWDARGGRRDARVGRAGDIARARDARDGVQRERASRVCGVRGGGWWMGALARAARGAGGDDAKNEAKRD